MTMATCLSEACYFKVSVFHGLEHTREIVKISRNGETGEELFNEMEYLTAAKQNGLIIQKMTAYVDSREEYTVSVDTPVKILLDLGYTGLNIWLTSTCTNPEPADINANKIANVFDIMMHAPKNYDRLPDKRSEKNEKDRLYNTVIDVFEREKIGFTNIQVNTTGKLVVDKFCSVLWFCDGRYDKLERRGIAIPDMFKDLTGFRNYKEQHKKVPEFTAEDIKSQVDNLAEILMLPWILNPEAKKFRSALQDYQSGLSKYRKFLLSMKDRTKANHEKSQPVRNLNDSWSLRVIELTFNISSKQKDLYLKITEALDQLQYYEPLDLSDFEPSDKEERRQWLKYMALPFPVTLYTHSYGNYIGNVNILWKIPTNLENRSTSAEIKVVKAIQQDSILKFATRRMRKEFIEKYNQFASPVILRNMFYYLTGCEYSPETEKESKVDLRFCKFLVESDDTDLIYDMRKLNGRPKNEEFELFWGELQKYLDENTAVHERRTTDINYLPFAISVEDLREIIKKRLPADVKVPSVSWIKLNFHPGNPYNHTAANYTGRFKVKYQVQQRLLRNQHEDGPYGKNLFTLLKSFACRYREYSILQSLDDKAIIPIGEPGHAVSTGVRAHHGGLVVSEGSTANLALDHDFHIAGIVPSVCFIIDIPPSPSDSFYNGTVHVTVKDKIFQHSTPARHAAETMAIAREYLSEDGVNTDKPILIRYTDGGPDHRVNYKSVQLAALLEFLALDLDLIILARTAPSMSYSNPAERTMSVLNLALQNVALQRKKMTPDFEMMGKSKTLSSLRALAERNNLFKEKYMESTAEPMKLIMERFKRLKWKGNPVLVHEAAKCEEIQYLLDMLKLLDGGIVEVTQDTVAQVDSELVKGFLEKHSRSRHYIYQLKKCRSTDSCIFCTLNPPRIPSVVFDEIDFVPDPTVDANGAYKTFDQLYKTKTTDADRPSLKLNPGPTERDKQFKSLLVGTKVRGFVSCCDCGKRRVVYGAKKLDLRTEQLLQRVQEELIYVCGAILFPGHNLQDIIITREGMNCNSQIEVTYYSGVTMTFDPICIHCGDLDVVISDYINNLRENYGIVRPICQTCIQSAKPIVTRNAVKTKKTRK